MEKEIEPIDISLYHLVFIGNTMNGIVKAFAGIIGKVEENDERALYVSTCSLLIINTISFLDEYHHFIHSKDEALQQQLLTLKKTVRPAIDTINQWTELRDFRNHVLAHNLRDAKINRSVFERGLSSYDIPQNGADLHILVSCITMIKDVFESVFKNRMGLVQQQLNKQAAIAREPRYTTETFEAAYIRIQDAINENIRKIKSGENS